MPRKAAVSKTKTSTKKTVTGKRAVKAKVATSKAKSAVKKTSRKSVVSNKLQEQVEKIAYDLYLKRGGVSGNEQFDWYLAKNIAEKQQKKKAVKKFDITNQKIQVKIQKKAYELYEQQGRPQGADEFNWYVAEQLVKFD